MFLQSVGFNMRQSSHEKAFALLNKNYGKVEKNIFGETQKFVLVSQLTVFKITQIVLCE